MRRPPFCPQAGCEAHFQPPDLRWYDRYGSYHSRRCGRVQRYRCRYCGQHFSEATFTLDYYAKRRVDYSRLMSLVCSCSGIRQMSRILHVHRQTVSNRIMRLARQAIAVHSRLTADGVLGEPVVADGLVSYWVSQYVPNEFTVLLGAESRFLYSYSACSKRRSGRMSDHQRRRRAALEGRFRANPQALKHSFSQVVEEATRWARSPGCVLELRTDEHRTYTLALGAHGGWNLLLKRALAVHHTTSSRRIRSASNPLAVVNTFDRSVRNDLAEHVRETIRFARSVTASVERFALYAHWHNYRKPASINEAHRDDSTHGEQAAIPPDAIRRELRGFYTRRRFLTRTPVWAQMREVWLRVHPTPFRSSSDYLPRYLLN